MIRIEVTVARSGVLQAPGFLGRAVLDHAEVVNVATLGMDHFAQEPFANHVHQSEIAIALQPHGGPLLGGFRVCDIEVRDREFSFLVALILKYMIL